MKNGHGQGKAQIRSSNTPSILEVFLVLAFAGLSAWSYEAHSHSDRAYRKPGFSTPALDAPETLEQVQLKQQSGLNEQGQLDPAYAEHEKQWAESLSGSSAHSQSN